MLAFTIWHPRYDGNRGKFFCFFLTSQQTEEKEISKLHSNNIAPVKRGIHIFLQENISCDTH